MHVMWPEMATVQGKGGAGAQASLDIDENIENLSGASRASKRKGGGKGKTQETPSARRRQYMLHAQAMHTMPL